MRIKVLCHADRVPPTPTGNASFPANAEHALRMLYAVDVRATYEPGMPIYAEAGDAVVDQIREEPWVASVEEVARRPAINPAEW